MSFNDIIIRTGGSTFNISDQKEPVGEVRSNLINLGALADPSQSLVQLFGGTHSHAGENVNEHTALYLAAMYCAVRNISEDLGKLPILTYQNVTGKSRGRARVNTHPIHQLLHNEPNCEMSPFDFKQAQTACAIIYGNSYARIERNPLSGYPVALWPIEPWRVWPRRDASNVLYYLVDGWQHIPATDMFVLKGFGQNGVVGYMTMRLAKESLGILLAANRYAAGFFGNGAKPGGIIKHPKTLTDKAAERLKQWLEGAFNRNGALGTAVLEEGMDWIPQATRPDEAQALETRQFGIIEVAQWTRMPVTKLFDLSKGIHNNVEAENIAYSVDCLHPWMVRWESEISRKLKRSGEGDIFAEFDADSLLRGDLKTRYDSYQTAVNTGWLLRSEAREKENLPWIPGLDIPLVNSTMMAAAALETTPESQRPQTATPTDGTAPAVPVATTTVPTTPPATEDPATTEDEINPSDSEGVSMSTPHAPPPGVLIPGAQPTDSMYYSRCLELADTHTPILTREIRRLLKTESDKIERALTRTDKAEDFGVWADKFYQGHATHVRSAIQPLVQAFAESVLLAGDQKVTPEFRSRLNGTIDEIVAKHLQASRSDLVDADGLSQRIAGWEEFRSEPFAKQELRGLLDTLVLPPVQK